MNGDRTSRGDLQVIDLTGRMRKRPATSPGNIEALAKLDAGEKEAFHDHTGYKTPMRVYVAQLCKRRGIKFRYQVTGGSKYKIWIDRGASEESGTSRTEKHFGKHL